MRDRHLALWLVVLVAVATVTLPAVAGANIATVSDEDIDPDVVFLDVHIPSDSDAEWTIEHRVRLQDSDDETAFEELQSDIEAEPEVYTDRFRDRFEPTIDAAATATDREMAMTNVTVDTETRSLPQEYGIVRYQFTWEGFVGTADGNPVVGDAIAGLFLDDASTLRISWDDSYQLDTVAPEPSDRGDRTVLWRGPIEFGSDEPRVTFGSEDRSFLPGSIWLLLGVLSGVIALAAMVGWWLYRREDRTKDTDETAADVGLLSNEERVLQLIADNGGRMKQQAIVQELDWTDAKTSQVVGNLRDEGKLEGFRLGRENVVRLPDDSD